MVNNKREIVYVVINEKSSYVFVVLKGVKKTIKALSHYES